DGAGEGTDTCSSRLMAREMLPLVALALGELLVGFGGAGRPSNCPEQPWSQAKQLDAASELQRHDVDLGTIRGDRGEDRIGDPGRSYLARHWVHLEARDRPHPSLADEGWTDHRCAHAGAHQLRVQRRPESPNGELS